jgi:hypothetical protein
MIRALASCDRQDRRFFPRALHRGRRPASRMPDLLWLADFVGLASPVQRPLFANLSPLRACWSVPCTQVHARLIARNTHCRALRPECRKWGESGRSTMRPTWPFRRWSLQFRSRLSGEGRIGFVGDSRCSRGASTVHDSSPCRNIRAIPAPSPSRPGPSGRIADAGDGEDRGKSARCIHFSGIPALRKPA